MATNTNPMQFINPIDLGGNELINSLMEKLASAPSAPVAGRTYYNTTDNKAYFYNGSTWIDISEHAAVNIVVDDTYTNLADYITNAYSAANYDEGDLLVLSTATDPGQRVWINLGTNLGTAADFTAMSNAYDETEIKSFFSAGAGLDYADGVFSIGTGEVTETMLDIATQEKLNKTGATFSLAATGVSGVSFSVDTFTITHNFNTQAVAVVMRDSLNGYNQVPVTNKAATVNTVEVKFAEAPTDNQYKVTVIPMVF